MFGDSLSDGSFWERWVTSEQEVHGAPEPIDIRAMIDKAIFIKDGRSVSVTSSIGVSWTAPGYRGKAEDPIKAADMMLYQSKRLGRNMLSSMTLRNPVDLDHIGRGHLTNGDSSSDDDDIARINNF